MSMQNSLHIYKIYVDVYVSGGVCVCLSDCLSVCLCVCLFFFNESYDHHAPDTVVGWFSFISSRIQLNPTDQPPITINTGWP